MIPLVLSLTLALAAPPRVPDSQDVDSVLAQSRAALALDQRPAGSLEARGSANFRGTEAPFTLTFDSKLRFVARFSGSIPYTTAFDGSHTWERDFETMPRRTALGERDAALLSNWSVTGDWTAPGTPLRFMMAEPAAGAESDSITLCFTLDGSPLTGSLELDASTHLPRRITWTAGGNTTTQEMSGFGEVGDVMIPGTIRQTSTQGQPVTIRLTEVGGVPEERAGTYELSVAGMSRASFDPEIPAELEVRRAPTGHLLVHPLIEGADLGWFIFDTGAGSNVLSTPVAEEAGFEKFGMVRALGVGGMTNSHFYRVTDLTLGPVTMDEPVFVGIDLEFLDKPMGVRVGGVLGYELLACVVAEFDLTGAQIALHDPAAYTREGATWVDLLLYQRHPCVTARFEGHEGVFNLDTGAAQTWVTFHVPAIERYQLLDQRDTTESSMGGVGGAVAARSGVLEWFELGGRRSASVRATFATEAVGAFSESYLAGSIGGQLMAPYLVVFDYPGRRLGLVDRQETIDEPGEDRGEAPRDGS